MNPQQDLALWGEMSRALFQFKKGRLSLHQLVRGLGRTLERAETLREEWVEGVYGIWTSLEEVDRDSIYEMETDYGKARSLAGSLESFLSEQEKALAGQLPPQAARRRAVMGHAA